MIEQNNTAIGLAILLFFFNYAFLPGNFQLALLLSPFFLYYLVKEKAVLHLFLPLYFLSVFGLIHLWFGIDFKTFILSNLVAVLLLIFIYSFWRFYKYTIEMEIILQALVVVNFIFTIIALICLAFDFQVSILWYLVPFTANYEGLPRLKLFTLEASHYSFGLMPLFFYYYWRFLKDQTKRNLFFLFAVLLSLIISFSLGVISAIFIAVFTVTIIYLSYFFKFQSIRKSHFTIGAILLSVVILLFLFFPHNPLFVRIENIFLGLDTSGRGRTYEALDIAWKVLQEHNVFFGIGLGQFKIVGRPYLLQYYQYVIHPDVVRLPNYMAELLATFGVFGVIIKLLVEIVLFVRFKVFLNLFQLSLFIALFVYQFTGSYLFNSLEYVLWIIATYPKFNEFNITKYFDK